MHLMSAEEVKSLFGDIVEGLAFLVSFLVSLYPSSHLTLLLCQHDKSILHLDLKPGNVLLTWDDDRLMYVRFL